MPLTNILIKQMMKNPQLEINTFGDLAGWYAMPNRDPQCHIVWCFKKVADSIDYIEYTQYFRHFKDGKYIQYNTVAIPVMSFDCNKEAGHMVYCTGSTWWRKLELSRNDIVLLLIGMSPDSHFK